MFCCKCREQSGCLKTLLSLSCLYSSMAKLTPFLLHMISICPWCSLSTICLLLAYTLCFLEQSPCFLLLAQPVLGWCDANQFKGVTSLGHEAVPGSRVSLNGRHRRCYDHRRPGDYYNSQNILKKHGQVIKIN